MDATISQVQNRGYESFRPRRHADLSPALVCEDKKTAAKMIHHHDPTLSDIVV
jgi:hypothetical protein